MSTNPPLVPSGPGPVPAPARTRKRWFRRKRLLVPLILLVIIGAGFGVLAYRINQSLDRIGEQTTPPPVVAGNVLGGSPGVKIDTGPAQTALAQSTTTTGPSSRQSDVAQANPTGISTATTASTESLPASTTTLDSSNSNSNGTNAVTQETVPPTEVAATDEPIPIREPTDPPTVTEAGGNAPPSGTDDTGTETPETPDTATATTTTAPAVTGDTADEAPETPDATTATETVSATTAPAVTDSSVDGATETPATATLTATATATATAAPAGTNDAATEIPEIPDTATATATAPPTTAPATASSTTAPLQPASGTMNILLMGVDAPDGSAIDSSARPDVLSVLHLDWSDKSCRLLSIPRDTRVELPGYGLTKINHALPLGGIPYEQKVVSDYLGITLDHYGLIDFTGAIKIVDKFGGVEVNNPVAFTSMGVDFPAGPQTLNGDQALAYARYRGGPDGDFGRIGRQQEVLLNLLEKVSGSDLVKLIPDTLPTVDGHFRTDLSLDQMLDIARAFGQSCTASTLDTHTIPGTTGTFFDPLLQMDLSYVIVSDEDRRREVEWLLGD